MKVIKASRIEFVEVKSLIFNQKFITVNITESEYQQQKEKARSKGLSKPLLVERISNKVLSGNLLLLIALDLRITHVPVIFTDFKSTRSLMLSVAS